MTRRSAARRPQPLVRLPPLPLATRTHLERTHSETMRSGPAPRLRSLPGLRPTLSHAALLPRLQAVMALHLMTLEILGMTRLLAQRQRLLQSLGPGWTMGSAMTRLAALGSSEPAWASWLHVWHCMLPPLGDMRHVLSGGLA